MIRQKKYLSLMVSYFFLIAGLSITFLGCQMHQKDVVVRRAGDTVTIENNSVRVEYNLLKGLYSAIDKRDTSTRITGIYSRVNNVASNSPGFEHTWKKSDVIDELGKGKKLTIVSSSPEQPSLILEITLYEDKEFIVLAGGIENTTSKAIQVKQIVPVANGHAFEGSDFTENFSMLPGTGGWYDMKLIHEDELRCANNLLVTFGDGDARRSVVIGGLTYNDYVKYAQAHRKANSLTISLSAEDPIGKRVDPGVKYMPDDKFYLDFTTSNPFDNLEKYAHAIRKALSIELSTYDFPTVDLWYARGSGAINNSIGAVKEMDKVVASGFLKYAPVAICLEPDYYAENNQQGWWDDEHFQRSCDDVHPNFREEVQGYGAYREPYETSEKWASAVIERGGIPFIYMQPGVRSQDYADAFPGHMLFNKARAPKRFSNGEIIYYPTKWYRDKSPSAWKAGQPQMESYDYTDPGFIAHMQDVFANMGDAGIRGVKFDYPEFLWADRGGLEDKYSTAANAYRMTYKLANGGLGKDSYLHERNLILGYDIALGLVDVQRIVGDTQELTPEMVRRMALRWYKNRVVINLDNDSKHLAQAKPQNKDGVRAMLTMSYVGTGRLMLGTCFDKMSDQDVYDLSRIYPFGSQPRSARPVDMFVRDVPQIFDFKVNEDWHQVTLYNPSHTDPSAISVVLSGDSVSGELTLERNASYYIYDFWNDKFVGKLSGKETLNQKLRPGEARMLSMHKVLDRPQFISTDRHVMQGYVDLLETNWDAAKSQLTGCSKVVGGEEYKVVIAANGYQAVSCFAGKAKCSVRMLSGTDGLAELTIEHFASGVVDWEVTFVPAPPLPDVFISDLEPIETTTGFAEIKIDKSIENKPISIAGQIYEKGIGTHADSTLVYKLKPEYKRFAAVVGVDDEVTGPGTIEFMVYADERLIAETGVVAVDETGFIDVEIPAGSRQIRLVALQGADGMSFDHADWANAGFMLKLKYKNR